MREDTPGSPRPTSSRPTSVQNSQLSRTRTNNTVSKVSAASSRIRRASIRLLEADVPLGAWAASASATSKAPSIGEIRAGAFDQDGWHGPGQLERRASQADVAEQRRLTRTGSYFSARNVGDPAERVRTNETGPPEPFPSVVEETISEETAAQRAAPPDVSKTLDGDVEEKPASESTGVEPAAHESKHRHHLGHKQKSKPKEIFPGDIVQPNGYVPPPKLPWTTSTAIVLRSFGRWVLTPLGFLITLYSLNVVAWGGMLFLLLCQAAPAMCHPTCNDLYSPRRKWLEIDSQILNALFCVTGFGLIPWRFRDLYWLLVYRIGLRGRTPEQKMLGLRTLAGIHRGWFRLQGSQNWQQEDSLSDVDASNPAVPLPLSKRLDRPLTGFRAPPTAVWKLDFVIWGNVWNTFFQVCLCGFMWGLNRFHRPSWSTGLFIALACIVAGAAGIMMFVEGKKVKRWEGVQPNQEQQMLMQQQNFAQQGEHGLHVPRNAAEDDDVAPEDENIVPQSEKRY